MGDRERIAELRAEMEERRQKRGFPHEPSELNAEADVALTEALDAWEKALPQEPTWCKNCVFAAHLHGEDFLPPGCTGFEPADRKGDNDA